jgi:hypothetical protein
LEGKMKGFSGESVHRCKCFGEDDGRDGSWFACPPDLCEADALLARAEAAEAERNEATAMNRMNIGIRKQAEARVTELESEMLDKNRIAVEAQTERDRVLGAYRRENDGRLAAEAEVARLKHNNEYGARVEHDLRTEVARLTQGIGLLDDEAESLGREADRLREALDEAIACLQRVVEADRDDSRMGHPNAGDSCIGACIGLDVMPWLDQRGKLLPFVARAALGEDA